jgi:hypothetical protein
MLSRGVHSDNLGKADWTHMAQVKDPLQGLWQCNVGPVKGWRRLASQEGLCLLCFLSTIQQLNLN